MKKTAAILLTMFLSATMPATAQIESPNTPTVLDATWTTVRTPGGRSDIDLHLSGQSRVDYTIQNTTNRYYYDYSYSTTIEVRDKDGKQKAVKHYSCQNDDGNITWLVKEDGDSYKYAGSGQSVDGSIEIANGATGDYIYMSIKRDYRRYYGVDRVSVILSALKSTTTRYDLYDYLPLFGEDMGHKHKSNRIQDHQSPIDVYVHRTIVGNGNWSTLCLPFNLSHEQIKSSLGDNIVYSEFTDVDLTHKYINFTSTTKGMKAGKPYLIQNNGKTIHNFFADNVTFTKSSVQEANTHRKSEKSSHGYYFVGLLERTKVNIDEKEKVYNPNGRAVYIANPKAEGGHQQLKRLSQDGTMNGFRGYLVFPAEAVAGAKSVGDMLINLDHILNETTGVAQVRVDGRQVSNSIYTISGQYVGNDADTLPKGIYIRNGKKFVVK